MEDNFNSNCNKKNISEGKLSIGMIRVLNNSGNKRSSEEMMMLMGEEKSQPVLKKKRKRPSGHEFRISEKNMTLLKPNHRLLCLARWVLFLLLYNQKRIVNLQGYFPKRKMSILGCFLKRKRNL